MSKPETANSLPPKSNPSPFVSLADQFASMERHALDRMKTSVHEATRLYVDALDYAAALSAHWRSFALDAVRRVSETPAP
ncbi:MAG TPA: hypothetical protein VFU21_09355 [Kofleriaceae bacterium]|nr:hypothetical protein [Kofleriaceae bacterium]